LLGSRNDNMLVRTAETWVQLAPPLVVRQIPQLWLATSPFCALCQYVVTAKPGRPAVLIAVQDAPPFVVRYIAGSPEEL